MPRKVFFSFDFKRDARRVAQVRNCRVVGFSETPFLEAAAWETVERGGDAAIQRWIDDNLHGSSVTVVLIGATTASRKWVRYEIEQSYQRGNGLLGITLHHINDPLTGKDVAGPNPFTNAKDSRGQSLSYSVPIYDWIMDDGRANISRWIEAAAFKAGCL